MASRFLVPDRDQSFLRATSYRELLGPDDLVWTVIEVVEGLDLSAVYARYGPDPSVGGRPAFDPAMMLSLLVFGYCEGKRSARELESACRRDVAYQAICGGMVPDHATIARFRAGLDDLIEGLFVAVLAACAERGLVEVGRVALDGTRMEAAASKETNVSASRLAALETEVRQILSETHPGTDDPAGPNDFNHGDGDGEGGGWSGVRRQAENQRRLDRVLRAQAEAERVRQSRAADEQRRGRVRGGGTEPSGNLTDPDSRLQRTRNGFIQGYNGQAVVSSDQIVIAAELTAEATDVAMFGPMLDLTRHNLAAVGADRLATVLADAGYWSHANASLEDHLNGQGETVRLLIATGKTHQVGEIDPISDRASEATRSRHRMQTRLADPDGRDDYRQRSWLIEGTFAHHKTHRKISRFSRRGLTACDAEWKLIHLAGNILKIHRHTINSRPSGTPPSPTPLSPSITPSQWLTGHHQHPSPTTRHHRHPRPHHTRHQ